HSRDESSPTTSASSSASSPTPSLPPAVVKTEVRQLSVVDYNGMLRDGYLVDEVVSGECGGSSEALPDNPNAYRCFFADSSGSFVADPCFAFDDGKSVYCTEGPWELKGIQIDLQVPVAFEPAFDGSEVDLDPEYPWALEVVDPRDDSQFWRCLP